MRGPLGTWLLAVGIISVIGGVIYLGETLAERQRIAAAANEQKDRFLEIMQPGR